MADIVFNFLETPRLLLKEINPENFNLIFKQLDDKKIIETLSLKTNEELEREREKFLGGAARWDISFKNWLIIDKESKKIIGRCGFHTWFTKHFKSEMGYMLTEETFKRKGLMTEALREIVKYGLEEMELHRIFACISPDNVASLKIIEKLNFSYEGHLKEDYFYGNNFDDSLIYCLLKTK